nr:MAG TPA: hypothetical protein [Caudoviricetes sp.]
MLKSCQTFFTKTADSIFLAIKICLLTCGWQFYTC